MRCFSSPGSPRQPMNSVDDTLSGGLPHSEISGSKPARSSPDLFAACYVLHRLSVPRHPPDALDYLISLVHRHTLLHRGKATRNSRAIPPRRCSRFKPPETAPQQKRSQRPKPTSVIKSTPLHLSKSPGPSIRPNIQPSHNSRYKCLNEHPSSISVLVENKKTTPNTTKPWWSLPGSNR